MEEVFCAKPFASVVAVPVLLLLPKVDEARLPLTKDVGEGALMVVNPPTLAVVELEVVAGVSVADAVINVEVVDERPGVRGFVSRMDKSDCWNRIWRAGPTVNVPSRLVAPQTPPRKSVVSVVHV